MDFWEKFVEKWLLKTVSQENVLPIEYESIRHKNTLATILDFAGYDSSRVEDLEDGYFIQKRNTLNRNSERFVEVEARVLPLLTSLGIAPIYHHD